MTTAPKILIYLLRRDLRSTDNPVLHEVSRLHQQSQHPFTHFLPIYVFPADQVEVSGFLRDSSGECPYPEARSYVGGFWRCGPFRAKFLAESVWDLKKQLEDLGSGLEIRVGSLHDALRDILKQFKDGSSQKTDSPAEVSEIWMTAEEGTEEKQEEKEIREVAEESGVKLKLWQDEKYLVDDRDLPNQNPEDLSDVFTSFRKTVEPLRDAPRKRLARPKRGSLPPLPPSIPPQADPFVIPDSFDSLNSALQKPLQDVGFGLPNPPKWPSNTGVQSAIPFPGGESHGQYRVRHLLYSGAMTKYKDNRNGLLGTDFSTKLSAWLALGCITARWVHWEMYDFEEGKNPEPLPLAGTQSNSEHSDSDMRHAPGFGKGQNKGTEGVRFELLWRDYMRLCARKFGSKLFSIRGFRGDDQYKAVEWKQPPESDSVPAPSANDENNNIARKVNLLPSSHPLTRFLEGRTGTGLIDATSRELFLTGYTSNRARQNHASFLAKHLRLDWRLGAEWYECMLVDYDVSSNWGNWCYVAGVGNDPRGEARKFNPVKQGVDYDPKGEFVKGWMGELSGVYGGKELHRGEELMGVLQAWRLPMEEKKKLGLDGVEWVDKPLVKIDFAVDRKNGGGKGGRGRGGGGGGMRGGRNDRGRGRGRGNWRSGPMDKDRASQAGTV
ncbi:cryptochrome [Viridothelium virens]|uniref:Cryptochrome DASH n=1 Tax=Viridothelium virens TaxID=1048519 RepID=A0A6A6HK24_VIRVR|nr:cryptochrome [Viridothelium virens]